MSTPSFTWSKTNPVTALPVGRDRALSVAKLRRWLLAAAFVAYPVCAVAAFALHPGLGTLRLGKTLAFRIASFHGNGPMHFGHFLMGIGALLLVPIALELMRRLEPKAPWLSLAGGVLAIIGAMVLAMDKAALCFVPSALDTLSEADFQAALPALGAIFGYRGYLGVLYAMPVLPLGFAVLALGLVLTRAIARRSAVPMLVGALLMCNPDIDLVGLVATMVLAVGFFRYAGALWRSGDGGMTQTHA